MDVINNLIDLGAISPTSKQVHRDAMFHAVRNYKNPEWDRATYEGKIRDVFGVEYKAGFRKEAELMFVYMIGEAAKAYEAKDHAPDPQQLMARAIVHRDNYLNRFPWVRPGFTTTSGVVTPEDGQTYDAPWKTNTASVARAAVLDRIDENVQLPKDVDGKRSAPKGAKQAGAKAIYDANKEKSTADLIKMFMEQLNMSQAGARTYLYNIRKAEKAN